MSKKNVLLFGSSGQIGSCIKDSFVRQEDNVFCCLRSDSKKNSSPDVNYIIWDVLKDNDSALEDIDGFDAICYAQGLNATDSIYNFDKSNHMSLYEANCLYILESLSILISKKLLKKNCKICIISSIWQDISRQDKLSYSVTKSAIKGMVNSLAIDLAQDGHLINAVLPGAIDTEMTRSNLNDKQISTLENATFFNRLSNINDIASLVSFLCSSENTSITGQFINVDLGFCNGKVI